MWGRRWIRAEIWRNANEREREDYSSARFVDVSFLYLTLPLKRKKKLCSCNSVNKKICVLADRGQHWACKCRGVVADVEVALQWSHHPPLYKLHKSLKEGNTLNEEGRRESERERERIYIEHICNIPSFRIAERLVWFTARDNLGDTHAWWENYAYFRKFSCSPTFISPPLQHPNVIFHSVCRCCVLWLKFEDAIKLLWLNMTKVMYFAISRHTDLWP